MKEQELIDQMVKQMVLNLLNQQLPVDYLPLDPAWEKLIQGEDGGRLEELNN